MDDQEVWGWDFEKQEYVLLYRGTDEEAMRQAEMEWTRRAGERSGGPLAAGNWADEIRRKKNDRTGTEETREGIEGSPADE